MSTAPAAANMYWRKALIIELKENRIDEYSSKETYYADFAHRYGISSSTVKKQVLAYRNDDSKEEKSVSSVPAGSAFLGPAFPSDADLTSDGSAVTNALAKKLDELRKSPGYVTNGEYKMGCLVEVKVTRIDDTYVKLNTTDGLDTEVLLMIRDVTDKFIANLHYHFMVNDILVGEVIRIDGRGRLTVSTKGLPLPDYQINPRKQHISRVTQNKPGLNFPEGNTRPKGIPTSSPAAVPPAPMVNSDLADKLAAVKDEIVLTDRPAKEPSKGPKKIPDEIPAAPSAEQEREIDLSIPEVADSEMSQIHQCLSPIVGDVSPAADAFMSKLIAEHGIVGFSVAMARAVHGLDTDLSMIVAKEIERILVKAN